MAENNTSSQPDPVVERSRKGRNARLIGAKKERDSVRFKRAQGWVAIHNTHGPFDVLAVKSGHRPQLIEVKYGPTPFSSYPPHERALTIAAALQAGGDAVLHFWKHRASEPIEIHSSEWPPTSGV